MTDVVSTAATRSVFIDGLRGFALIGICVVNLPFLAAPIVEPRDVPSGTDAAVQTLVSMLFEGKFFLIFSFLFGFGFSVQLARIASGRSNGGAFARRLVGLFAFGLVHAVLFFPGDILMGYAVLGALLWWVRERDDRSILRLAGTSLAVGVLTLAVVALALSQPVPEGMADGYAGAVGAYRDGDFVAAMRFRLGELVFVLPFIALFNWPLAFCAFCLGLVAGRRGLLADPERLIAVVRPWLAPLVVAAVFANAAFAAAPFLEGVAGLVAFIALAVGGPCLATLYVVGFATLMRRSTGQRVAGLLAHGGRMSLTNYLGQSILANLIFMGWGLGLYASLDRAALLALAVVNAMVLIALSAVWQRRYRTGPEEWLLRSWIALKWQPFRQPRPPEPRAR